MKRRAFVLIITTISIALLILSACGGNGSQPDTDQPLSEQHPQETGNNQSNNDDAQNPDTDDNDESDTQETQQDESDTYEPQPPDTFFFQIGSTLIELDTDITLVLSALGEPLGIFERPSCAFDGMDIIYGYSDLEVFTYPVGDSNHVHTINFINDSPRTPEGGIRMGATLQDVLDAYGTEYTYDNGMYTYTRGMTILQFYVENDIVWGITYGLIIE